MISVQFSVKVMSVTYSKDSIIVIHSGRSSQAHSSRLGSGGLCIKRRRGSELLCGIASQPTGQSCDHRYIMALRHAGQHIESKSNRGYRNHSYGVATGRACRVDNARSISMGPSSRSNPRWMSRLGQIWPVDGVL